LKKAHENYENHSEHIGLFCEMTQLQNALCHYMFNEFTNKYQNDYERINRILFLQNKIEAVLSNQALRAGKIQNLITLQLSHAMKSQLKLFNSPKKTSESRKNSAKVKDDMYYCKPRAFVKDMYQKQRDKRTTVAAKHIAVELEKYIAKENLPVEKTKKNGSEEWESWVIKEIRKIKKSKGYKK
jgi:hypothetical protein